MINRLPIEAERLIIRRFTETDAQAFLSWRADEEVARYTLWAFPYPKSEAEAFCREQSGYTEFPIGRWVQVFIEERETGAPVGDIGLGLDVDGDGVLEIGYSIHRDHWGKGYATEAVRAVIPVVAEAIGATRVKAEIDARNPASGKVLTKLGFEAGPLQEKRSFVKGEWCDEIDYVLHFNPESKNLHKNDVLSD